MTQPLLISFLEINRSGVDYCVVCLRTSSERRLEPPNYLKKFLESIEQPFMYQKPKHKVCYVCERQAAVAYKLRLATNVAASAHSLVKNFMDCDNLRINFLQKYNTPECEVISSRALGAKLAHALECEARLSARRARTQFSRTEMLIVSTTGSLKCDLVQNSSDEVIEFRSDKSNSFTVPGESSGMYVIPDNPPGPGADRGSGAPPSGDSQSLAENKPESGMESIIIFDDDDQICNKVDKRGQTAKSKAKAKSLPVLAPTPAPVSGDVNTVASKDTVPRLAPLGGSVPARFLLHPIVMDRGVMTVPSLSVSILNGRLVTNSQVVMETPRIALERGNGLELIVEPGKVTNFLNTLTKGPHAGADAGPADNIVAGEITRAPSVSGDVTRAPSASGDVTRGVGSDVTNHIAREAVLNTDRIDWEDKIPMDLISFMDADENTPKRPRIEEVNVPLSSQLGVISNVTSLREKPPDDVIDLC